jgi:purine-binding chemotaxis protein CheW
MFGIEIRFVTEIVGLQKINDIPECPDYVKGIINLRGKIIPVIDMRLKFKKNQVEYDDRTCIIVIDIQKITVGLIVDNVDEVVNIPDASIVPPPSFRTGFQSRYIKGIGKSGDDIRLLLDCELLFADDEIETLNEIKE